MKDGRIAESLWGGMIWGDCVGRLHRGWHPDAMDTLLGEQFFVDLINPARVETDWLPILRAVDPVQRRAFVEVGLPGHAIQFAMVTASILADNHDAEYISRLETAMSEDAFRMPNSELIETMYRICRSDKQVDGRFVSLFFPSLMHLCLDDRVDVHDALLEVFRPFVPTFAAVMKELGTTYASKEVKEHVFDRLTFLFPDQLVVAEHQLSALTSSLETTKTPEAFWHSARSLLQQMPYVGNVIGLIGVMVFGAEAIVPWHRIKDPNALETLVSNRPLPFDVLVTKERERTNLECLRREEVLAERRAVLKEAYR